jgi:hypothetical protein
MKIFMKELVKAADFINEECSLLIHAGLNRLMSSRWTEDSLDRYGCCDQEGLTLWGPNSALLYHRRFCWWMMRVRRNLLSTGKWKLVLELKKKIK